MQTFISKLNETRCVYINKINKYTYTKNNEFLLYFRSKDYLLIFFFIIKLQTCDY